MGKNNGQKTIVTPEDLRQGQLNDMNKIQQMQTEAFLRSAHVGLASKLYGDTAIRLTAGLAQSLDCYPVIVEELQMHARNAMEASTLAMREWGFMPKPEAEQQS